MIRIGHSQSEVHPDDFDANVRKVVQGLKRAADERIDILSFPECFLTGYWDRETPARKHAFAVASAKMRRVLAQTRKFSTTLIVGFNELRGRDLYNTCLVAERGKLLGLYSKSSAYMPFHKQGRDFPVFTKKGVTFGVVICSDGGYIEPTRILAIQGARIVFAPHYNYIGRMHLLSHFTKVRADHTARAVENDIWFVRGNQHTPDRDPALSFEGVGYGDSYILSPDGEILVRSKRHQEDFIWADIDPRPRDNAWGLSRSLWSAREFSGILQQVAAEQLKKCLRSRRAGHQ